MDLTLRVQYWITFCMKLMRCTLEISCEQTQSINKNDMSQCNYVYSVPSIDNNILFFICYLLYGNLIGYSGK
jgi:hypothetical protein